MEKRTVINLSAHLALVTGIALLTYGVILLLTVPLIEQHEFKDNTMENRTFVGGEWSHADVRYIDNRPAIDRKAAARVWWETKKGEWRRLECRGYDHDWSTVAVLRDIAYPNSTFGVGRGTKEAENFQRELDAVKAAYEHQSPLDRVWRWRVEEFH